MRRALLLLLAAATVAGCESTQAKSARLEARSKAAAKHQREGGLKVTERSREVRVEDTAVLHDSNGAAAVVTLRNVSGRALAAVPLAIQVRDRSEKRLYANDAPGLDSSLVSAALLAPRARLIWVDDQVTSADGAASVLAVPGAGARAVQGPIPKLELSQVKLEQDPSSGLAAVGQVTNRSAVEQRRLVIHAVARKGAKIVAAGRAIVARLAPGRSARFSVFFIGDPSGARLSVAAPPTVLK
jgi:hypothetical protein